jgi:sugar/nucleoside kinase (ribokinase family)
MDVVCLGNATTDVFILLNRLQKFSYDKFTNKISFPLGDKVPLDEYRMTLGGNACNVSVGLTRLGFHTALAVNLGSDEFSRKIEKSLIGEGVNLSLAKKNDNREDHFNIILAFDGERTILEEKSPENPSATAGNLNPKLIYLTSLGANWWETYEEALLNNPISKFAMNPGSRQIENNKDEVIKFLPKMEILFLNLAEAQSLIGEETGDVKGILSKLSSFGSKIVVITDGRNGSYAFTNNQAFHLDVVSTSKPKERTGAGDAYSSGFIYGYITNKSIEDCMKYGAINADSVISKIGGQEGLLKKNEMEEKHNNMQNLTASKV